MSVHCTIRDLTIEDKERALEILADAFKNDPLFINIATEKMKIEKLIKAIGLFVFNDSLNRAYALRGVFEHNNLMGCGFMETNKKPTVKKLFGGFRALVNILRLINSMGFEATKSFNEYYSNTRKNIKRKQYDYLTMIAVSKSSQGKGYGGLLLRDLIDISLKDLSSEGIYLDTENRNNVDLYEHFQFTLDETFKYDKFTAFRMFRKKD